MKKSTILFVFFLWLTFNIIGLKPAFAGANTFKEGVYTLSDLSYSKDNIYTIQNISKDNMLVNILDENQVIQESIRIKPGVQKLDTVPIGPDYSIIILGKGEVYFTGK